MVSRLRRYRIHTIPFMCIIFRNKAWIATTSFTRLKDSASMQLIMVRWCSVLGAERALSTTATCFIGADHGDDDDHDDDGDDADDDDDDEDDDDYYADDDDDDDDGADDYDDDDDDDDVM